MPDVTPLTPDIVPAFDGEREMVDYLVGKVRQYARDNGRAPTACAVVLLSDDGRGDTAYSWAPGGQQRHVTCGTAAALLFKRAMG